MGRCQLLLIQSAILGGFKKIEQRARGILKKFSLPGFPISEAHFIKVSNLEILEEELEVIKTEFYESVESFVEHYVEYKNDVLDSFPTYRELLEPC